MSNVLVAGLVAGLLLPFGISCSSSDSSHAAEVDAWHRARMEELRQPDSWLSLVGLYWLEEGENRFGSGSDNDIVFPSSAPEHIGSFVVEGSIVRAAVADGVQVTSNGQVVDTLLMKTSSDDEAEPTPLSWGSLTWILLERDGRFAIRLKDSNSSALADFDGIDRFPVDSKWRIEAQWEPYVPPRTIEIPTVMGTVTQQTTPGRVIFTVKSGTWSLDVTGEPEDAKFFVVFADQTNSHETYPAGRYLWIEAPAGRDHIIVDFNKSYNPPCVFTPYATCPFPPPQNRLGLRVEAGEMNYESGVQTASLD